MAALSCYQPCRSHLAQPARCLDEGEEHAAALSLRRRQLVERCREAGAGRRCDLLPEVSVKRTREQLAKHAAPAAPARRLNVDSGWSKVEQVRKKFEGAASTSYSRSFESPPRRRLADSLFASFKLPRKKEMSAPQPQPKRKSAVELLAETKAFYVKSETVRDRKQELPLRVSSGLSQAIAAGGCHLVSSAALDDACCTPYATSRASSGRRTGSAGDGLQSTLRRLLQHADSREDVYSPPYACPKPLAEREVARSQHTSGTSSPGTSASKERRLFAADAPYTPRLRLAEVLATNAYCMPSAQSSSQNPLNLSPTTEQLETISPPAEYAHSAPRYTRSNSHSQPSARADESSANINSHKSLPDLHAHAERSNHSSLMSSCDAFSEHPSPGEEMYQSYNSRCGSSFARDSGGSSGHCTQRSAPPLACDLGAAHRERASRYSCSRDRDSSMEQWLVSAPPQFQDGAPSPPRHALPPATLYATHSRVGIHFQASAPPPQFQDEPPRRDYGDYDSAYKASLKRLAVGRKERGAARQCARYQEANSEVVNQQPQYQEVRIRPRLDDSQEYVNTPSQGCQAEEATSPLGTFKRQRCLRYKQRRPKPILRSKSDISDRYRRSEGRGPASAPCEGADSPESGADDSRLQTFFDRLGLESRTFDALVRDEAPTSPVFFSSASTLDSNQLATTDYTVQGPPGASAHKQAYRNTEPPSVVERNARIIKWLCQCRKVQMQPPQ